MEAAYVWRINGGFRQSLNGDFLSLQVLDLNSSRQNIARTRQRSVETRSLHALLVKLGEDNFPTSRFFLPAVRSTCTPSSSNDSEMFGDRVCRFLFCEHQFLINFSMERQQETTLVISSPPLMQRRQISLRESHIMAYLGRGSLRKHLSLKHR